MFQFQNEGIVKYMGDLKYGDMFRAFIIPISKMQTQKTCDVRTMSLDCIETVHQRLL